MLMRTRRIFAAAALVVLAPVGNAAAAGVDDARAIFDRMWPAHCGMVSLAVKSRSGDPEQRKAYSEKLLARAKELEEINEPNRRQIEEIMERLNDEQRRAVMNYWHQLAQRCPDAAELAKEEPAPEPPQRVQQPPARVEAAPSSNRRRAVGAPAPAAQP